MPKGISKKKKKSFGIHWFFSLFTNAFRRFFVSASDLRMSAKYVLSFFRSGAVFDDLSIMGEKGYYRGDGKNPVSTSFMEFSDMR